MVPTGIFATLIASDMPGSQELRYNSYWMLFIVSYALILTARQTTLIDRGYYATISITFFYIVAITGGNYLYGEPYSAKQYIADSGVLEAVAKIPTEVTTVCLRKWSPDEFLFDGALGPVGDGIYPKRKFIVDQFETCRGQWILSKPSQ